MRIAKINLARLFLLILLSQNIPNAQRFRRYSHLLTASPSCVVVARSEIVVIPPVVPEEQELLALRRPHSPSEIDLPIEIRLRALPASLVRQLNRVIYLLLFELQEINSRAIDITP